MNVSNASQLTMIDINKLIDATSKMHADEIEKYLDKLITLHEGQLVDKKRRFYDQLLRVGRNPSNQSTGNIGYNDLQLPKEIGEYKMSIEVLKDIKQALSIPVKKKK